MISEHFRPFPIFNFGLYHFASRPFNFGPNMKGNTMHNLSMHVTVAKDLCLHNYIVHKVLHNYAYNNKSKNIFPVFYC